MNSELESDFGARNKPVSAPVFANRQPHKLTYIGLILFVFVLYFRPYDFLPGFSSTSRMAQWVALATAATYFVTQLSAYKSLTEWTLEIKCALFLLIWALLTAPIAYIPELALETWTELLLKVVVIFVIAVNSLKTVGRVKGLLWIGIAFGLYLGYQAISSYYQGVFLTEGYRVSVGNFGFGASNDMSLHLVVYIPIALAFGLSSKSILTKLFWIGATILMIFATLVTQSRGGFLGLITVAGFLVWNLGRGRRTKAILIALFFGLIVLVLAPGNFGVRMLSVFDSSLDPVGSSGARSNLLMRSILVSLRNPLGVGLGNSAFFGVGGQGTHNAYTQVSSELGWLALAAYLALLISPLRKLRRLEAELSSNKKSGVEFYLAVGLQAGLIGYMVASFFNSVAYIWYVYFPIAAAIGLSNICRKENVVSSPS